MPIFDEIPPEQDYSTAVSRPIPIFILVLTLDGFLGVGLFRLGNFCGAKAGHGSGLFEPLIGPLLGVIIGFYYPIIQLAFSCMILLSSFFNPSRKLKTFAHGLFPASLLFAFCYYFYLAKYS